MIHDVLKIEDKIVEFIHEHRLFEGVNKVYVATSGGADSMALLNFLNKYKDEFDLSVAAVHVNHGIRGETADRDEEYVRKSCEKLGIYFISFNAKNEGIEVPENASEEWARQLRYSFFDSLIEPGAVIATAHTLSDQAETLLFRLARGGYGLHGLSGIQVKRDGYVRPFLSITRSEVEQLCSVYLDDEFMTDETNLTDDYSRNKIRHHVIPVLKEINENAESSIEKAIERISKAQDYIEKLASNKMMIASTGDGRSYDIREFIGVEDVVLDEMILMILDKVDSRSEQFVRIIKEYLGKYSSEASFEQLLGVVKVTKEVSIVVTTRYITICKEDEKPKGKCLPNMTLVPLGKYPFRIEKISYDEFKRRCTSKFMLNNFADVYKLDLSECVVRSKATGDTFKPACMHRNKVSKFMVKIPFADRDNLPLVEYKGEIIWVWGSGFTDGFTPTEETKEVYQFIPLDTHRKNR